MTIKTVNNLNFGHFQQEVIEKLKSGQALLGKEGVLTPLIKQILEAALEGEMESHLQECQEQNQPNRRNGKLKKSLKTTSGSFELETPRDRESSFEPDRTYAKLILTEGCLSC
jgi:transposase-like protein